MSEPIKYFVSKTPDNVTITFAHLNRKDLKRKKENDGFVLFEESKLNANKRPAGTLNDGSILYEIASEGSGLLFPNEEEYFKSLSGTNYWDSGIFWSRNTEPQPYLVFSLLRGICLTLESANKKLLDNYQSLEGYKYYLLEDSSVCSLLYYEGLVYGGNWYPTMESFIYCYDAFAVKPKLRK